MSTLRSLTTRLHAEEAAIRDHSAARKRKSRADTLSVRERIAQLVDRECEFLELGLWAAWQMYPDFGDVPAAGVVCGIGSVCGRPVLVVANDSSVKAGAFFPQTVKKVLRAQAIAMRFRLPLIYLVDSAGVFLPLQDEIFPDEDDFGRIFRNNAVISAMGIPQFAAVMGNCVAGGAYLPVLCDTVLMTEGSRLYLAGPALVKAAVGQSVDPDELGGASMHAEISGTVDYREPDDASCLRRLRSLIELLPKRNIDAPDAKSGRDANDVYNLVSADGHTEYDARDLLACVVDDGSLIESRADYGRTLVTAHAKIGGHAVGVVASQRHRTTTAENELQIGGVVYGESAEKAARFVMACNQQRVPLVFVQDVQGFMVGRSAEQSGIIRSGAKLANAVSNSVVPKLTVIIGGSFGAGHYALCGKAYDPWLIVAWPNARYAVMGAAQAADTLLSLRVRDAERAGKPLTDAQQQLIRDEIVERYEAQTDIRYGAARGWVDAIIAPHETRHWLSTALSLIPQDVTHEEFKTGVFQV